MNGKMIFEPESWTGLRSQGAVAAVLADRETIRADAASDGRKSVLRSAASRVAGLIDRIASRNGRPDDEPANPDFLRKRRVTVFDETDA
ncbi:MAG: hypothetical protein KIT16_12475 [Rhodospirillaceae bacterium]|nr:hypothetical protein [Rhodospirillaceae bacterium]